MFMTFAYSRCSDCANFVLVLLQRHAISFSPSKKTVVDLDGSRALPAVPTTRYFNGPGVDNIIAQENYAGSQFAQGT